MKVLVTGATGFLGSRASRLFEEHGHEVVRLGRPGGSERAGVTADVRSDAGDPASRELIAGCDAVLHFAGIPDPARAREDPARAVRENVGTTLNLLEGCLEHGAGLVYPSTVRAALVPPADPYAHSKRLGEEACRLHEAPTLVAERRWNETVLIASGRSTPLLTAAQLVREAAGSPSPIETPGGELPAGENESYQAAPEAPLPLNLSLEEGIRRYVDWLKSHPAAQVRCRA